MPITRSELRGAIYTACQKANTSVLETERLIATADDIDRALICSFADEFDGQICGCPATLAGYVDWDSAVGVVGDPVWSDDATDEIRAFPSEFDIQFSINQHPNTITSDGIAGKNRSEYIEIID